MGLVIKAKNDLCNVRWPQVATHCNYHIFELFLHYCLPVSLTLQDQSCHTFSYFLITRLIYHHLPHYIKLELFRVT